MSTIFYIALPLLVQNRIRLLRPDIFGRGQNVLAYTGLCQFRSDLSSLELNLLVQRGLFGLDLVLLTYIRPYQIQNWSYWFRSDVFGLQFTSYQRPVFQFFVLVISFRIEFVVTVILERYQHSKNILLNLCLLQYDPVQHGRSVPSSSLTETTVF